MIVPDVKFSHSWMAFRLQSDWHTTKDQHKTTFIFSWGNFAYKKLPFGLKNVGATFQRAMSYAFNDIKTIVQPYLDDLPAKSWRCQDHIDHLQQIFVRCRHYNIRLNPHKCIFGVESGHLLGFIVANDGIHVDPLNVEANKFTSTSHNPLVSKPTR